MQSESDGRTSPDDELIGSKVEIVIQEDGTSEPPELPLGTITKRLVRKGGLDYYVVVLDQPVPAVRSKTGNEWTLHTLIIIPRAGEDANMDRALFRAGRSIPVRIANAVGHTEDKASVLGFAGLATFGIGTIRLK